MNKIFKMKCGHTANAVTQYGTPCCAICDCEEIEKEVHTNEGLEGRTARCSCCGKETPSRWDLPFFQHEEDKNFDSYYCGCWGWD